MRYEGIICPKEGQVVDIKIPKSTIEKIRFGVKSAISLALAAAGVSSLVACSGSDTIKKEISPSKPEASQVQTTEDEELQQDSKLQDIKDPRFNQLLSKLDEELAKKDFPELANDLIRESMYSIYSNYDKYKMMYKDMPDLETYIQTNLINVIAKKLKGINMIDMDSPEGQDLMDFAPAWVDSDYIMTILYKDPKKATEEDKNELIQLFLHEDEHASNEYNFDEVVFDNDDDIRDLIMEGKSTFHQIFGTPLATKQEASWCISNSKGDISIEYGLNTGVGNAIQLYAYQNLVNLLGYEIMEKVGDTEGVSLVKEELAKKYGEETSQKLWKDLGRWYKSYLENWQSDKTCKLAIELQNDFLKCIMQDISSLSINNKQQVRDFVERYRYYKLKAMPQVFDSNLRLCTNELFDIDLLDDMLIDKIEKSGALDKFSSNQKLNKMALKCMLYASNKPYIEGTRIAYLPSNIQDTDYYFMEYDIDGKKEGYMVVVYQGEEGETRIRFTMDEKQIINSNIGGEIPDNQIQEKDNER